MAAFPAHLASLQARFEAGHLRGDFVHQREEARYTLELLHQPAAALLARAAEAGALSARGWSRTMRLARTIADLEGQDAVRRVHVAEALIYRRIMPAAEGVGESRASVYGV